MEAGSGGAGEQEALAESFCAVTSSTREEALFFLESHNWMLDAAVHSYFESDDAAAQQEEQYIQAAAAAAAAAAPSSPVPPPAPAGRAPPPLMGHRDKKPTAAGPAAGRPVIRTLDDLNRRPSPGSDEDSDEPQEYYTGGEKSGMLVQDPSKGNHDVDAIFDQAREMGALEGPLEHHPSLSSRNFTGTGRLLSGETVPSTPQQPENLIHSICFWRNGFTVNDGPLRRFDDPENASFLESIKKSECPKELEPADRRSTVNVNLTRKEENCPEPVKHCTPFQGMGRTLGSGSSSGPVSSDAAVLAAASCIPSPSSGLSVDESLPTTSIQLRLADGTRMVARFNTHHTVGDIRAFINASRPGAGMAYQLQTVDFPPKQLTDVTKTIEEAGLPNSVVIQRL